MTHELKLQDLKWFIYCRKSSDSEDKQIQSLPAQVKELTEIAIRNGYTIVDTYLESHSAFHPGRPEFNNMMDRLYSGEANAVLVWASNRIARNAIDAGKFIYAMDLGQLVAVKTIGATFFNTSDNKMALNFDFTLSKKSSDDLSASVHRGNREKFFENKEWSGPAKQGFINYTDPYSKKRDLKVDQERFDLLQEACKKIVSGIYTPMEALDWLNKDMGFRTVKLKNSGGNKLAQSTFYKTLSDPFYYGLMIHKIDGVVQEQMHKYPKMLSKDEWDVLQIRLGKKSRSKQTKQDFPYKGVLRCGECNGFVTAEEKWQIICPECKTKFAKTKNRDSCIKCGLKIDVMANPTILHYTYYHCTKKVNKQCSQGFIEQKSLEAQIHEELKKFEIDPDFKDWAIAHLHELNEVEAVKDEKATLRNVTNYEGLKNQLRRMTKFRFTETYEASSLEEKEAYELELQELNEAINSVKENINEVDTKQQDWLELSKKTFEFACYARHWFDNGDTKTKTQILSMLGQNLKLHDKKILIDKDNPFWIIEKAKKDVENLGLSLEPTKMAGLSDKLSYLEPAIPRLLRD